MSSQNEKKSWTFVPERSRPPANKRATRRKTTLRAFTFVQDWDPRISPIPSAINNIASQKKASHKKDKNKPVSSQSSESSIRESPIAQLVRSSPGPIIVARRVPGSRNKSFRSPHPLSPSTSISSQSSLSSRQKSFRSPARDALSVSGETGVSPAFSVPRTRGRQQSSSKKQSPVSQEEREVVDTSPGVENIPDIADVSNASNAARLQEGIISGESSSRVQLRSSTAKKNKRHLGKDTETPNNVNKSQSPPSETSARSTRSRKRQGPKLTVSKKSTKGRTSLSFNAEDKNKSVNVLDSIDENFSSDDGRREQSEISPPLDDPRQATRTSPRTTRSTNSTSQTGGVTGETRQSSDDSDSIIVPVGSDIPTPGSVGVPQRPSTSSDRRRTGSRRKRGPSLTFKKKSVKRPISFPQDADLSVEQDAAFSAERYPSSASSQTRGRRKLSSKSSGSDSRSPESVAKRKSASPKGQKPGGTSARSSKGTPSSRSSVSDSSPDEAAGRRKSPGLKGPGVGGSRTLTPKGRSVSKKILTSKTRAKELAKTPDRSMSFITTTPKSGHVVRQQPRTQVPRPGPVKATGPAGQRKRGVGTESSELEEPVEKRAKVRLYTTGARPRLVGDTTDMDILLNCLEDTTMEFRDALDAPRRKKAVTKFMEQARHELTEMISMQHDFRLQSLSLSRTNSSIRRYRQELLNLQRENTSLDVRIAEIKKKREKSHDHRAKALKGIDSFVSDLQKLHQTYASKYPKDIKSGEPVAQQNAETVLTKLKPTIELQNTTASLSNKLREWLGSQLTQK